MRRSIAFVFRVIILSLLIMILATLLLIMNQLNAVSASAAHTLIFERQPGPDVPTLQEIAGDALTDEEVLNRVAAYYELNRDRLAALWREDNPTRLAGIFTMYVTHISQVYGETPAPGSIIEFMGQERAHCGTYIVPQHQIAETLGLTWRTIEFVGEHAWVEIYVDDHWELFDATTNVWLSHSGLDLLQGAEREYRGFYTPMLDINRPDARLHIDEGYNMQTLRRRMPTMGIQYMPPGEMRVSPAFGPLADDLNT